MTDATPISFAYRGQSPTGQPVSGTVEALTHDGAMQLLADLGVRITEVERTDRATRPGGLAPHEFHAFNQQLAHLTRAGLPVERGLRLIAQEATSGRFARAAKAVADAVERGMPLGDAFRGQRSAFPPLYGQLIDAGVAANDLPGMLFNLNRHVEMVQRLRAAIWQAVAYPLVVAMALAAVMLFLSIVILPTFREIFQDFDTELPTFTMWVISMADWGPIVFGALLALLIAAPIVLRVLRSFGLDAYISDGVGIPLPLIGPVLRKSLVARWCDAARVGVEAGLDLPAAMRLASEAIASPGLRLDTLKLMDAVQRGDRIGGVAGLGVLTRPVPAAMELGIEQGTLSATLGTLAHMYREQAEARVRGVQVLLSPILLVLIGLVIGFVILGLFLPLIKVTQSVM